MAEVVVIGAGLGGLPTAYELRNLLPRQHTVTLISDQPKFTFIPGLIQVALGLKPLNEIQLDLKELTARHGIKWIQGKVTNLDRQKKQLQIGDRQINYDYVAIATGASLAFDEIPGLGVDGGYTHSVCTPDHALAAKAAWKEFLQNPGALVVGAMPGAACFGPAYEFVLMADWELRRRGLREQVSISFLTPEPYPGHLGIGALKNTAELTSGLLRERGIKVISNVAIAKIDPHEIHLANSDRLPFQYAMILPSFRGVQFLQEVPELTTQKGFIPVLPTYRHQRFSSIYALGVTVDLEQPEKTPIPISLPKTGQMTEAMGLAVAHNIAVELGVIAAPFQSATLESICFAEFGNTGIAYIAAPILPDPVTGKRRYFVAIRGRWVKWVKEAFERYFLWKMRLGMGVPWFERWGLRILLGLSLLKPLPEFLQKENSSCA
ncbi:MAG: FAD-dependent oxidoreductase [Oscillatoria sp. PMC 1051.18]|nr:FAD-dependent oxidoreductase [Oscillatoria sp. PMC 1050.18]MEC5029931.1 FAD-dependent oxidoreductase [Oscillatoria sp. PMC 1051.18]